MSCPHDIVERNLLIFNRVRKIIRAITSVGRGPEAQYQFTYPNIAGPFLSPHPGRGSACRADRDSNVPSRPSAIATC